MEVQLQSTQKIVELVVNGVAVPARVWEGHTAAGIPCHAFITRIAVKEGLDDTEFERDLQARAKPTPEIAAIPLRMII
jgi:hypothetical protein